MNLLIQDMIATAIENKNSTSINGVNLLSDKIIADFIFNRNRKSLKDLKGKIAFRDDYDYKSMRK